MTDTMTKERGVIDGEVVEDRLETDSTQSLVQAQTRGEIDIQIATARRFPRSLTEAKREAMAMATLDAETADSCIYYLPRGEGIEGPSIRFAEILANAWGHIRVDSRIMDIGEVYVTAKGICWDLQKNVAIGSETKRRIQTKEGKRYNDDMIGTTSNAAIAIARRNSILAVIPQALWHPIYLAARKVVEGDVKTMTQRRDSWLEHFEKMGVPAEKVFAALQVKGKDDISLDHIVRMTGMASALKNGELTIEGVFGVEAVKNGADPLDGFLAELPPDEQADIKTLVTAAKQTKGQVTTLLKKYTNDPKGLKLALLKLTEKPKADETKEAKAEPKAAKADTKQPAREAVAPSVAEVFKAPVPKSFDDEVESI